MNAFKKIGLTIFLLFTASCGAERPTSEEAPLSKQSECVIGFENNQPCHLELNSKALEIEVVLQDVFEDEKRLDEIIVLTHHKKYSLKIPTETFLMEGDKGHISINDINFDGAPDIAVTTSFRTANLYLDYWVYDPSSESFHYIGNLPSLEIDTSTQSITSTERLNAVDYKKSQWIWQDNTLVKKSN